MKVVKHPVNFQPVSFTVTLESPEEVEALGQILQGVGSVRDTQTHPVNHLRAILRDRLWSMLK